MSGVFAYAVIHPQVQLLTGLLRAWHYVAILCLLWEVDEPLYEHQSYHVCKQQY